MSLVIRHPRLVVLAAVVAAFANALAGDFVFDDIFEIEHNPAVRLVWPPWQAMTVGSRLPARLLPSWSFAVDHAIWGDAPRGYHVANIAIHALAAIALYDLVRLTLASPRLRGRSGPRPEVLALAIAVIWAVHPLQTQAVTYVYQRIESMAGMFVLLSLACFARAAAAGWQWKWLAACVAAAAAAMASKESAIVLPLLILTYDWTFWAEPPAAIRGRWRFYAAVLATTAIVAVQLWLQRGAYGEFQEPGPGTVSYALTQPGVILHYICLAAWPAGQCLDYDWPIVATTVEAIPPLVVVLAAVLVTAVGLAKRRPWAWPATAFFLTLAPTSSIMPVMAPAAEHRMYLPLASLAAGFVYGLTLLFRSRDAVRDDGSPTDSSAAPALGFAAAVAVVAILLGVTTHERNAVYRSRQGMWQDVAAKRPDNFIAQMWMAGFAYGNGDEDTAIRHAEAAVARRPRCSIFQQLAEAARNEGRLGDAAALLRRSIDLTRPLLPPDDRAVLSSQAALAEVLAADQRQQEAEELCRNVVDRLEARAGTGDPATVQCRTIMVRGLVQRRAGAEAVSMAAKNHAAATAALGAWHPVAQRAASAHALALQAAGDRAAAERVLRETAAAAEAAAWRRPVDTTSVHESLAGLLESSGRYDDAIEERRLILDRVQTRAAPDDVAIARARLALLGVEAAGARQQGRLADEESLSRSAATLARDSLGDADPLTQRVLVNHAAVLLRAGKAAEAELVLEDRLRDADAIAAGGGTSADVSTLRSGLADLYERTGRIDESLVLRRAVLRDCLERHGPASEATQRAAAATQATARAAGQRQPGTTAPAAEAPPEP